MKGKKYMKIILVFLNVVLLFSLSIKASAQSGNKLSRGQTVYVPIYSHIYSGDREMPFDLAATISIRNTDPKYSITILSIDFYDTNGKFLKKYIETPVQLNAMATIRYVIRESDKSGGSGAKFIIIWRSERNVNAPLIESVMISTKMQQGISFTSRGKIITEHTEKTSIEP